MKTSLILAAALPLLAGACDRNTAPSREPDAALSNAEDGAPVVPAYQAVESAKIATTDPAAMSRAEIDKVLPAGPGCGFALTSGTDPVLVVRAPNAGGVTVQVAPLEETPPSEATETRQADMTLTLEQGLNAGFRGYYTCEAQGPGGT